MASTVETIPSHHQLSFTRHSASLSTPLATLPQPPAVGTQPEHDSKTATPTHQRQMSFGLNGSYGTPNGVHQLQRPYGDSNGAMMQQYPARQSSSIYTAQYSGVAVYEMEVNSIAVMRRRSDAWLNATQILKVAGVDKGKRTKVLDKEILTGEHEKVQGGYGKYQGTWISYKRGRDFCRAYGVEELLRPLLDYDMGADGQAGTGAVETPTKEQALAAQRKKMMMNGMEGRPAQTPNGTFFKNISATAANAIQAINKARFESPSSRPGSSNKRTPTARRSSQHLSNSQDAYPGSSQQSMQSLQSDGSFGVNGQLDGYSGFQANFAKPGRPKSGLEFEPPRKRIKHSSQGQQSLDEYDDSMMESTPTEPNESFVYRSYMHPDQDPETAGARPLPQPNNSSTNGKQDKLISLFVDPTQQDFANHPSFEILGGEDLDTPIDSTAHTAMHWGATLAKPSLIRTLVSRGANIFRVNHGGETALMKAVQSTNNYELVSFAELLEVLGPSIETRDDRGRTVLHHIAVSSSIRGKNPASRYYLVALLQFVLRNGSKQDSSQGSANGSSQAKAKSIGIAKFMSDIVNAQDMAGDTALNIAARNYSKGIVQQLLEVGANPSVPNSGGFKPLDFGIGAEMDSLAVQQSSQGSAPSSQKVATNRVAEGSRDLITSLSTLIGDAETSFRAELQAKQTLVDEAQAKLRDATTAATAEKRRLTELDDKETSRQTLESRLANLRTSNDSGRSHLATTGPPARQDVVLGDADTGLEADLAQLPPPSSSAAELSAEQGEHLAEVPGAGRLQARARAYHSHNAALADKVASLRGKSFQLEHKLRRLIIMHTDSDESQLDAMLGPLRDAVESEGGQELDDVRLREFLRKVRA